MNLDYSPVFDEEGRPAGVIAIVVESTSGCWRSAACGPVRSCSAHSPGNAQLVWRAAIDGACIWSSPQWNAYTGQTERTSRGWGWLDAVHPDDYAVAEAGAWRAAPTRGLLSLEHRLNNAAEQRFCWFQTRAAPVRDAQGRIVEWLGTSTDIDDLRQLQERQQVMVAELQHRTRNLLGVVRAIAKQTMAQTGPGETFRARFNDRLSALSRVQGLLSRSDQEPITLRTVIETELAALDAPAMQERIRLDGPVVRLRKATVQTFALALHELATNALKYGALTTAQGRLSVTWRTYVANDGGNRLHVEWVEEGLVRGPDLPDASPGSGYGRELIERALPYALKGDDQLRTGRHGATLLDQHPAPRRRGRRQPRMTPPLPALAGRRVLLVEDDYFIAIDLKSGFEEGGAQVLGPVPSVSEALRYRPHGRDRRGRPRHQPAGRTGLSRCRRASGAGRAVPVRHRLRSGRGTIAPRCRGALPEADRPADRGAHAVG